jgi:hypothetical protein
MKNKGKGKVHGLGKNYKNGVEALEVWIQKSNADFLPYKIDEAVEIEIVINNRLYHGLLRATSDNEYVWISPKIFSNNGKRMFLANVLIENDFIKNQEITLSVDGSNITIEK